MAAPTNITYTAASGATVYGGRVPLVIPVALTGVAAAVSAVFGRGGVSGTLGGGSTPVSPFQTVTFLGEAGANAGPQPTSGQIVEFALHGSGGNPLFQGLNYEGVLTTEEAYLGKTGFRWNLMTGYNEAAYPGGPTTRAVIVQPEDSLTGLWGTGRIESLWLGWIGGAHPGEMDLCTERWLDGLYEWMDANQPNFSSTRRILTGASMGGWGGMTYGMRRPEKFAAMYLAMPRWRFCEPTGNVQLLTWGGGIPAIPAGSAPPLTAASGGGSSAAHLDLITYVQDTSKRIPWLAWTMGRQDGYAPFADQVAAVAAMRAAKRGFCFSWNNGTHGAQPSMNTIYASYPKGLFELGKGYPLFTDHSLDQDPAVDLVGSINLGLSFRNVVESEGSWSCEVTSTIGACTVKVEPISEIFTSPVAKLDVTIPAAGTWVTASFELAPVVSEDAPELLLREFSGTSVVSCCEWNNTARTYDRSQNLQEWVNGQASFVVWRTFFGEGVPLPARTYPILINGVEVTTATFEADRMYCVLSFSVANVPEGWVTIQAGNLGPTEWSPLEWAYNRKSTSQPTMMPKWEDSHHRAELTVPTHQAAMWVPTVYNPRAVPMPERVFGPVTTASQITAQVLTRFEPSGQLFIPNKTKYGTVNTATTQSYNWFDAWARWPVVPLVDGPRGVGAHGLGMHLEVGLGAPNGVPRRNWYMATPWSVIRGKKDGTTTTLVGYRHVGMASYWEDGAEQSTLELVGDWSGVPLAGRHMYGVRSFAWDEASLALDENAAPIPGEPGQPHFAGAGPVLYIAEQRDSAALNTSTGRILRVQFSAVAHDVPPVVTEFVTGLRGSWGVLDWGTKIIVSERNANRIISVDKATKAITVLVEHNPALPGTAQIRTEDHHGFPYTTGTLAELRAQPVVAPEDIKMLDGKLYIGSYASRSVIRYDMTTWVRDPGYNVAIGTDTKSWAVKFALSDGTFYDRGTLFYNTWGQSDHAGRFAIAPDGVTKVTTHAGKAPWTGLGYPFGVAVGNERLYHVESNLGVTRFTKSQDGDLPMNVTSYQLGWKEYEAIHGSLRYGPAGFGDFGHRLPWGQSAGIDYYLARHDLPNP